jgi:hypothetical protein
MTHTPGPWTLHPGGIPYVKCGDDGPAFGPVVMAKGLSEMMANARLIAAAPDLLAALKALVPADFDEHPGDFAQDWHDARIAIAKAEHE